MTKEEIISLGNMLSRRRLKSKLWRQLQIERPTLSWDTVLRAFNGNDYNSDLLPWIQEEGKRMLEEDDRRIELKKMEEVI